MIPSKSGFLLLIGRECISPLFGSSIVTIASTEVLFSLQIVDVYLTSSKQTITTSGYANESRAESGRGGLSDFVRLNERPHRILTQIRP